MIATIKIEKSVYLGLILIFMTCLSNPTMNKVIATYPLKDLLATNNLPAQLNGLNVFVQLDSIQNDDYIDFAVHIENRNEKELKLLNPLDFVQLQVLNQKGEPLPFPPVIARQKLPVEEWERWVNPQLPLVQVALNEGVMDLEKERKKRAIHIPAQATYKLSFRAMNLLENSQLVPFTKGDYYLIVTTTLLLIDHSPSVNRMLQSDQIKVSLDVNKLKK